MRKRDSEYIIVDTKYGKCRVRKTHYNKGVCPTITTAINKNEYFINQAKEIHGDRYYYDKINYINASVKVLITCSIHGDFLQTPNSHISRTRKQGCPKCGRILGGKNGRHTQNEFIEKSNNRHSCKCDYSKSIYNKQHDKIVITCPIHGDFEMTAKDHLRGQGCAKCGRVSISKHRREDPTGWSLTDWIAMSEKSIHFDSFKCYVIRCFNDKEEFVKIGRTFNKVSWRFRNINSMPYEYEIIKEIEGSPKFIVDKETELKRQFKEDKYVPLKKFHGRYECFNINILEKLIT